MSFKRLTLFLLFAISVFWGEDVSAQSRMNCVEVERLSLSQLSRQWQGAAV